MSKNNKLIKIMLIALLCISICFTIFSKPEKTYASEGTITVKASAGEVIAGNTIIVEVKLNNPAGITSANFELIYDGNIFAYVSGMDGSGFNGVIPFSVTGGATEQTEYKWNITFKANQTGTCNFTIKGYQFIDTDVNDFSPACGSASVKVMAVGSDDATLSSIQVGGANLSPAFAKWTLDYKCYVDNSVTSVNIAATSSQGGRVEIAGNTDNLAVGNNYVTITSYAPNGKAMKYNLNIFRLEPPTDPPTEAPTDPPTEPPASFKVTMDGKEYNVSSEFDAGKVPDGFEVELGSYNGKDVITATGSATGFTLMYLVDSEGNGNFYVYDGKNFYPYIVISNSENTYYVFDSRKADTSMAGEEKDVKIKDTAIKGYVDGEYIYFYAMNSNKKYSWYSYDTVEGTIQRLRTTSPEIIKDETTTPEETASTPVTGKNDDGVSFNNKNIIIIGGALLLIVIAGAVIFLISKKTKKYDGYNEEFAATYEHPDEETIEEDIIPVTEDKPEEESAPESEEK